MTPQTNQSPRANRSKTVLVLFGGESAEHEVSMMSARNIAAAFNPKTVTPIFCYIDMSGAWRLAETVAVPTPQPAKTITPILGKSAVSIAGHETHIDVIFPILHGAHGEDGTVQGLASLMHTPIVGCGVDGSAICIDKVVAKQLLEGAGIPVVPYVTHRAGEVLPDFKELAQRLGATLFIKPVRQGSSVGAGPARSEAEFTAAIKEALRHDQIVLIESAVEGVRELEIAALGDTHSPRISVVGEILPDREFYSYESKYHGDSASKIAIPAQIPAKTAEQLQAYAKRAFELLHCRGLARIDFFVDARGAIFLNEVNTMPGFTNISMYPKLWEASGLPYGELIQTLIDHAA